MSEESLNGERSPVPEVTSSDGGSACAAERGRSRSGVEPADPRRCPLPVRLGRIVLMVRPRCGPMMSGTSRWTLSNGHA